MSLSMQVSVTTQNILDGVFTHLCLLHPEVKKFSVSPFPSLEAFRVRIFFQEDSPYRLCCKDAVVSERSVVESGDPTAFLSLLLDEEIRHALAELLAMGRILEGGLPGENGLIPTEWEGLRQIAETAIQEQLGGRLSAACAEPPTTVCSNLLCEKIFDAREAYVSTTTGYALCPECFTEAEQKGRARRVEQIS